MPGDDRDGDDPRQDAVQQPLGREERVDEDRRIITISRKFVPHRTWSVEYLSTDSGSRGASCS